MANHPEIEVTVMRPPRPLPVDMARSWLVSRFLQDGDWDYLWFTDQDAAYVPNTLDRLLAWDEPIVGALCMMRGPERCMPMLFRGQQEENPDLYRIPTEVVAQFLNEHADITTNDPQAIEPVPEGSLFEVDFTGCHCVLIKREVLEAMEPPWFSGHPGQEDKYFYLKAQGLGWKTSIDLSILVGHVLDARIIGAYDFMAHYMYENVLEEYGVDRAES
jgi:hypothetical protein